MPENAKEKNIADEETRKDAENESSNREKKERSYYYDDACGYEIYDPEEDEEGVFEKVRQTKRKINV